MIRRAWLLLAASVVFSAPQRDLRAEFTSLLADLASALSANDAAAFLGAFDQKGRGFPALRANVTALLEQSLVSSSVRLVDTAGDDRRHTLALEWVMQIRPSQGTGPAEKRQQSLTCKVERKRNRWVLLEISPVEFFAPPKPPASAP
jgi:hypothetical protein